MGPLAADSPQSLQPNDVLQTVEVMRLIHDMMRQSFPFKTLHILGNVFDSWSHIIVLMMVADRNRHGHIMPPVVSWPHVVDKGVDRHDVHVIVIVMVIIQNGCCTLLH